MPRLLLAEPDRYLRSGLTLFLEARGWSVDPATGANDAFRAAIAGYTIERPDIVLAELWLPDADGLWLIDRLHAMRAFSQLPAVIYSEAIPEGLRSRRDQLGVAAMVLKPCSYEQIASVLLTHCPRARPQ